MVGTTKNFAAIDCGTNSTRLMIGDGTTTFHREMHITRLGQGVDETSMLAPEAIERTMNVLVGYKDITDTHDISGIRITATSAARDATNREELFGPIQELFGVEPELLSGLEEGELSFWGATSELAKSDGPFVVVDIGGGSTEVAWGNDKCEKARSLNVGCVRMTERFLESDPPRPEELSAALSYLDAYWAETALEIPEVASAETFVGLAGTVATVAAVEIGLAEYDRDAIHHFVLTRDAVEDVFRTLATESRDDRVFNPGLSAERADVIVGGCIVLVSFMRHFGFEKCLVSESDILDGLIFSQTNQFGQADKV